MSMSSNQVCKYNQTGFCKYKDACNKVHENKVCEHPRTCIRKDCNERHPKTCKHFSKKEGCHYKEECAYLHKNRKSIQQDEINHAVSVVVSKHNNEIMVIQEEVKILKDIIKIMKEKLDAIDKAADKVQDTESVEVQEEEFENTYTSLEKEPSQVESENRSVNNKSKELDTKSSKSTKKGVQWIHCENCNYRSKSENTLKNT